MARLKVYLFFISITSALFLSISSCEKKEEKPSEKKSTIDLQEKIHRVIVSTAPSVVKIVSKGKEDSGFIKGLPSESISSGFIIDKDQNYLYIITTNHGIESKNLKVVFKGNIKKDATVVGKDKQSDVALLKVSLDQKIKDLPPLKPYTGEVKVGYFVLAAGSPYNLGSSYTFGIISALHRNFGFSAYEDYIQTDASLNPGDSGGPLFDINGRVVGMNSIILESGEGLGFALPIKTVLEIYKDLREYGYVKRGWLGVLVRARNQSNDYEKKLNKGVVITRVFENSPAARAGLKKGDILISINGKDIKNPAELSFILQKLKPDTAITVNILRNKQLKTFKIKIEEKPKG